MCTHMSQRGAFELVGTVTYVAMVYGMRDAFETYILYNMHRLAGYIAYN